MRDRLHLPTDAVFDELEEAIERASRGREAGDDLALRNGAGGESEERPAVDDWNQGWEPDDPPGPEEFETFVDDFDDAPLPDEHGVVDDENEDELDWDADDDHLPEQDGHDIDHEASG